MDDKKNPRHNLNVNEQTYEKLTILQQQFKQSMGIKLTMGQLIEHLITEHDNATPV